MAEKPEAPVSEKLLEVLACPVCRSAVELLPGSRPEPGLQCRGCGRIYPVRDGIPIMLKSESHPGDREKEK